MENEIVLRDHFSRIVESPEPYPVDFDQAWQWVEYSTKQKAREALERNFEEGQDFLTTRLKSTGGRPGDGYFLTVDCFKSFCMMAGTEKGKEVRRYYLQIEKDYLNLRERAKEHLIREAIREPLLLPGSKRPVAEAVQGPLEKLKAAKEAQTSRVDLPLAQFILENLDVTGIWYHNVELEPLYQIYCTYALNPLSMRNFSLDICYANRLIRLRKDRLTGCKIKESPDKSLI
jgi:phage anti-repressor protein